MSLFGISDTQLQQLQYPNGMGSFSYGGASLAAPAATSAPMAPMAATVAPVSPAGAAAAVPGVAAAPAAGMDADQASKQRMAYGSIASSAISQIADVASKWAAAKAKAEALKNQSAIPNIPESGGALAGFQAPSIRIG